MKRLTLLVVLALLVAMLVVPTVASAMTWGELISLYNEYGEPGYVADFVAGVKAELDATGGYAYGIGPAKNYGQWVNLAKDVIAPY